MRRLATVLALCLLLPGLAVAQGRDVPAGGGALALAIKTAGAGDTLRLGPGRHAGGVELSKPLTLECAAGALIDAGGQGSVLTLTVPDITIRGCAITGSGSDHEQLDSGIRLLKGADRARILQNHLTGNLYGVDIHGARKALVAGNVIEGRQDHRMNERGNGVYVWNAPGSKVVGNDIRWGRDGIFANTSRSNAFVGNRFRDLRFAVHFMYTNKTEVSGNLSIGNHLGFAVMFSKGVKLLNNVSLGDAQHGIMLNYTNSSEVRGNLVKNGADRCLFIYNAHKNVITGNRFER